MKTIRFSSPSGRGTATAIVQRRGDVEFVEIELSLFREVMDDLGFTEESDADVLRGVPLSLSPEPHVAEEAGR